MGFTSTTIDRVTALNFAFDDELIEKEIEDSFTKPVLIQIDLSGNSQFFYLNSKKYSAFPGEQEVLLQDGI